jgi:hypothetical protein
LLSTAKRCGDIAPLDLWLSFDRLVGVVREHLGEDPRAEALFSFHNRARTTDP